MRKRIVILAVCISALSLNGCGSGYIQNSIQTVGTESMSTSANLSDDKQTTDNTDIETTKDIETTSKEETTTKEEETTTSTKPVIPGVEDFDVNAPKVQLPSDSVLPGDDFSDAVFIGDSRTEGLTVYKVLTTSTVLATRGLMACEAYSKKFVDMPDGTKGTAIDYIKVKNFNRVYIMLGLNEMGGTVDNFTDTYGMLIDRVKEALPDAKIYAISILPMIEERTDSTYNNVKIKKYNEALELLVKEKGITYVNAQAAVVNDQGTLRDDLSKDGIHLRTPGLTMFLNYLILATSPAYN